MIVENREKFIKRLKLSSNVIKFIFAKSLFSLGEMVSEKLLFAVASVVMNRFVYEAEISDTQPDIIKILTSSSLFPEWKNTKYMDGIDVSSNRFKKCFGVGVLALSGKLKDSARQSIAFMKKGKSSLWADGLLPCLVIDDYAFYNNCA